jgi:cytochrome c peroxidase
MRKWLIALAIVAGLASIGYFTYNKRSTFCDGIVKQTIPDFASKVDAFKAGGKWLIGKEKMQGIDRDSQDVLTLLKACCAAQHNGSMKPEGYQACLTDVKSFEAKIVRMTNIIEEAEADMQEGRLHEMDDRVTEVEQLTDELPVIVRNLRALTGVPQSASSAPQTKSATP